jgi:hypothetical protein
MSAQNRESAGQILSGGERGGDGGVIARNDQVRVLSGAYREGEDYMQDVLSQTDRELMRIFPSITEPEYVHTLVEIYCRVKHLESSADRINRIAALHHERIQQERLGTAARDQSVIAKKTEEISREVQRLWASHREYCSKRQAQARECSEKFKNVYQISNDFRRWAVEHNRKSQPRSKVAVFSAAELAFIRWYVSVFGDNWRLIADVLGYHPYTRGSLRTKEQVARQYAQFREAAKVALLASESTPVKPWRTTGAPLLSSERPPSLYCSIHPINQMHQICIKNLQ